VTRSHDNDNKRLMGRVEAAEYCDLSPSAFSQWITVGRLPKPIAGTHKWDKRAIDARLDELSGISVEAEKETDLQKWRRERDARKAQGNS